MKKYGIWNIVAITTDNEVVKRDITATSGKDAKSRMLAIYPNAEILNMTRKAWLDGFSYAQISAALLEVVPVYANSLLVVLNDGGVFSAPDEERETSADWWPAVGRTGVLAGLYPAITRWRCKKRTARKI